MNKCVFDASALLALLNSENGAKMVEKLLPYSLMSTVNVAEVIAELDKKLNIPVSEGKEMVETTINKVIPFDLTQAIEAGRLRKLTESLGLSLGDRACIALGLSTGFTIYTTDKAWSKLKLDCEIVLIR